MLEVNVRQVQAADIATCHAIEQACFSLSEAASTEKISKRALLYQEGFLVAEVNGQVVAFINSGAADNPDLSDEDFKDLVNHDPNGSNMVVLSIAVDPNHQGLGISRILMEGFTAKARRMDKEAILRLCKQNMIKYYQRFNYIDAGRSASGHGGSQWHEMRLLL